MTTKKIRQTQGAAMRDFAKALKQYAAKRPGHGDTKLIGSSDGAWSLNDIAGEIERGTKRGKEFYGMLKDVIKLPKK